MAAQHSVASRNGHHHTVTQFACGFNAVQVLGHVEQHKDAPFFVACAVIVTGAVSGVTPFDRIICTSTKAYLAYLAGAKSVKRSLGGPW